MNEHRNWYQKFKTDKNHYVYDCATNLIIQMDALTWELLNDVSDLSEADILAKNADRHDPEAVEKSLRMPAKLRETGICGPSGLRTRLTDPSFFESHTEEIYEHLGRLILSVTEQCNLRCSYCAFSGGYQGRRTHGLDRMSREVAQAALDYYSRHLPARDRPSIGFYGGEPLLELDLIRFCLEYWRQSLRGPECRFALTTNGLRLKDEATDFLAENDFSLLISLDGPREVHDANRIDLGGRGTFDRIWKNILRLSKRHPDYFRKRTNFSMVLTPYTDFSALDDFVQNNREIFEKSRFLIADITPGHADYQQKCCGERSFDYQGLVSLRRRYFGRLAEQGEVGDAFLDDLFRDSYLKIHSRIVGRLNESSHLMPSCVPGELSLFVDVKGNFHICEKVPGTMSIGNVWSGVDHSAAAELYRRYSLIADSPRCRNCWAVRMCPGCYATFARDGRLSHPTHEWCNSVKRSRLESLKRYCAALEENPHSFDYLDSWKSEGNTPGAELLARGNTPASSGRSMAADGG